jgi:hypothetical protein
MATLTFKALIYRRRFFVAECLELGIEAEGRSPDEALACLRVETEEYLATLGPDPAVTLAALSSRASHSSAHEKGVLSRRYTVEIHDLNEETLDDASGL